MSEKSTPKKKAEKKAEAAPEVTEPAPIEKNNTLAHPVDRSILKSVTTTELNPAYQIDVD